MRAAKYKAKAVISDDQQALCYQLGTAAISARPLKTEAQRLLRKFRPLLQADHPTEIPLLHTKNARIETLRYKQKKHTRGMSLSADFSLPSRYLTAPFQELIVGLALAGWRLAWVRLIFLPPGVTMKWHVDKEAAELPTWRLHLPLQSNRRCRLEWKAKASIRSVSLAEDSGLYLVRVNTPHRALNHSKRWRIHLVASLVGVPAHLGQLWRSNTLPNRTAVRTKPRKQA